MQMGVPVLIKHDIYSAIYRVTYKIKILPILPIHPQFQLFNPQHMISVRVFGYSKIDLGKKHNLAHNKKYIHTKKNNHVN